MGELDRIIYNNTMTSQGGTPVAGGDPNSTGNMFGVDNAAWLQMSDNDRLTWNRLQSQAGATPRAPVNPLTLPNYSSGAQYDDYGTVTGVYGPYGGNAAYGGGPNVGYGAVGPPNSGGGAGYVGSGYGYTPAGPPVASVGTIANRGRGIYADAAMYRGGDFAGAGSGDGFGGGGTGPTENIQGSPVADLSLSNYTPGSDQNTTPYDNYGSQWEDLGGGSWIDRMTGDMHDLNYGFGNGRQELAQTIYNGGGIGSDAARAPNDYGSSSYPYNGTNRAPQNTTPQMPGGGSPWTGPVGWPYGPAGGGSGFGRTGSVSDPGGNVDLGFGQAYPGYTRPTPGTDSRGVPGGFDARGYPGGQIGPGGGFELPPGFGDPYGQNVATPYQPGG